MNRTLFAILALCFVSLNAMALTEIDRQELRWRNYHTNGGFESGITGVTWSVAPSAALGTLESVEKLNGNRSLKCLASQSNGYCETKLVLIPGQSGAATLNFFYKSAGTNWQAILEDEDNNEISVVNLASSSSFFTKQNIRYTSDQGVYYSLKVKDTSTSGFLPIYIDDVVQGPVVDINENQKLNWDSIEFSGSDIADIETKSHSSLTDIGTYTHDQIDNTIDTTVSHINDPTIHFTEASIDHDNIQNVGTTSHADIDIAVGNSASHIANTSNPHSVTKTQVGLGSVTNDAQVKAIPTAVDGNLVAWDGTDGDAVKDSGIAGSDVSSAVSLKHQQGTDAGSSNNSFLIGSGIPGDKFLAFNIGGANPAIKWNNATSKLQYSNDGATYADIGSGGASVSVLSPLDMVGNVISINKATGSSDGYLSSVDWTTFNSKQDTLSAVSPLEIASNSISIRNGNTSGDVLTWNGSAWVSSAASGGITKYENAAALPETCTDADVAVVGDTNYVYACSANAWEIIANPEIAYAAASPLSLVSGSMSISQASTSTDGYLSSTDWNTFNSKEPAVTKGALSTTTTGVTVGSGTGAVIGSGTTIDIATSGVASTGLLSSTDWGTFNGKQDALSATAPITLAANTISINSASTSSAGAVRLSDSYTGTSQTLATTEKAVSDGLGTKENRVYENILANSSFESGVTEWNEGGGGTIASETTTFRSGAKALKFTFSDAGDTLYPTAVSVLSGTNNCIASFYYNTASAAIDVEVYFGATKVAEYLNLPANATGFRLFEQSFVCSDVSSAYTFKVTGGAASDEIIIDDVYIGINKNIGTVQQARVLGSIQWAATASCEWTKTNTSPADFDALAACDDNTITYTGNAVADASNPGQLPQIRLLNVPSSGHIRLVAESFFDGYKNSSTSSDSKWRFSDGTNTTVTNYNNIGDFASGNHDLGVGIITGSLDLTSGGDKTYKIQGSGGTGATIYASVYGLKITAYYYPSSSETVVRADTSAMQANGTFSSTCTWVAANSSYAIPAGLESCSLTTINSNNLTIASVSDGTGVQPQISFTPSKAGTFEFCFSAQMFLVGDGKQGSIAITDGAGTVLNEVSQRVTAASNSVMPTTICGIQKVSSIAQTKFSIMLKEESGGDYRINDGSWYQPIYWSIRDISQNIPMPQIVNSVTHSKSNVQRIIHGRVNSDGTIASSGTGDWSSSKTSTGRYTITWSPAWPSTAYTCTGSVTNTSNGVFYPLVYNTGTLTINTGTATTDTDADKGFGFICMGDK